MLFDTYAWVEFFRATEKGIRVRELIMHEPAFASEASLAEITMWALRYGLDPFGYMEKIERVAGLLPVDRETLIAAARVTHGHKKVEKNWGLFDGLIYATARLNGLSVVTGDDDFRGLPDVIML